MFYITESLRAMVANISQTYLALFSAKLCCISAHFPKKNNADYAGFTCKKIITCHLF
jgi:hypothetical protein